MTAPISVPLCCKNFDGCVNACTHRADHFKAQRDELLAALWLIRDDARLVRDEIMDASSLRHSIDAASAAIAKAEGRS